MNISNCNFSGVKWDEKAIDAVNDIAKALLNMTRLFSIQNIEMDCFVKVDTVKRSKKRTKVVDKTKTNKQRPKRLKKTK